jgi:hypothetical protein
MRCNSKKEANRQFIKGADSAPVVVAAQRGTCYHPTNTITYDNVMFSFHNRAHARLFLSGVVSQVVLLGFTLISQEDPTHFGMLTPLAVGP